MKKKKIISPDIQESSDPIRLPPELQSSAVISAQTDMNLDGEYSQESLIATTDRLVITELYSGRRREYAIENLEDPRIENMVTGGLIYVTVKSSDEVICRFSNTKAKEMGHFVKVLGKLVKKEAPTDADLTPEEFNPVCPTCGNRYPDAKRKICPKCLDRRSLFFRILSYLPRYKFAIALILICIIVSSLVKLLNPFLGGKILFDEVLTEGGKYHGRLIQIVLLMAGSQLLAIGFDIAHGRINARMTARVFFDLKTDIFTNMQRLSYSFFSKKTTGGLMTRINWDAENMKVTNLPDANRYVRGEYRKGWKL